jgi:tetratricopeptide (TPR) repeat protein
VIGETVAHYRIVSLLGGGGMGVVYKALDTRLGRAVALKFLPEEISADPGALERFRREAQAASSLNHPNICVVHDFDEHQGRPFLVLELLEGRSLKQLIAGGELALETVVELGIQVCRGLEAAHSLGIVHRDVKPANIFVTGQGITKLVDFGLVKLNPIPVMDQSVSSQPTSPPVEDELTRPGTLVGTTCYMAPEQARGEPADARSDIFSLGMSLYEALTGKLPFEGKTAAAYLAEVLHREPPVPSRLRPGVPQSLDRILLKALQKRPEDRYQSAAELRDDLTRAARTIDLQSTGSGPGGWWNRRSMLRSLRIPLIALALGALLLAFGVMDWRNWFGPGGARKDIAVLPFVSVGGSPEREAESLGLTLDLTSALTRVQKFRSSLNVVPASEVIGMDCHSPGQARSYFGVDLVVAGSLEWTDHNLRLTLNLVDARTIRQVDSEVLVEPLSSVHRIREEMLRQIDRMLQLTLEPGAFQVMAAGATQVPAAWEHYQRGAGYLERYFEGGNLERAEQEFQRALEEDPQFAAARAGLARARFRQYQEEALPELLDAAETECIRALRLDPESAAARVACGWVRAARGLREEAVEEFRAALRIEPRSIDALTGMALNLRPGSPDAAAAQANLEGALVGSPQDWYGQFQLGVFFFYQGRYETALESFRRAQALVPENYKVHNNLGAANANLGYYDRAIENFLSSVQIAPNYVAFTNLGTIYLRRGDFAGAVDMYRRALQLNGSEYSVWGYLANACRKVPDCQAGYLDYYRRAAELAARRIAVNPRDPWLKADRADYLAELNQREESRRLMGEALAAIDTANEPRELAYLGAQVYGLLEDRDTALQWLQKALELGLPWSRADGADGLAPVRNDPRYRELAARFSARPGDRAVD